MQKHVRGALKPAPESSMGGDLRGAVRLAVEAVAGLAGLVERVQGTVAGVPGARHMTSSHVGGMTAWAYSGARGATRLVGGLVDGALVRLEPLLAKRSTRPGYEALLAALNGVMGDWLEARGNPLAIKMSLRSNGVALTLEPAALAAALPAAGGRVVVLLHGLCMGDLQWARHGADFGESLARDLGATPIHLNYNTGRHVSTNGREFAALMDALVGAWPVPLKSIDLIAHSMGGLVARSALHQALQSAQDWPGRVRKLVFLGTPHHGAPLERGGQRLNLLLSLSPYTEPFMRLGQLRSAGITDLRYGNLLDSDWVGQDRFAMHKDARTPVPLPAGIQVYAIGAVAAETDETEEARVIGDGLVPLDSALGRHPDPHAALSIPTTHQWVALRTNHLELQTSPQVYRRVRNWLWGRYQTARRATGSV